MLSIGQLNSTRKYKQWLNWKKWNKNGKKSNKIKYNWNKNSFHFMAELKVWKLYFTTWIECAAVAFVYASYFQIALANRQFEWRKSIFINVIKIVIKLKNEHKQRKKNYFIRWIWRRSETNAEKLEQARLPKLIANFQQRLDNGTISGNCMRLCHKRMNEWNTKYMVKKNEQQKNYLLT